MKLRAATRQSPLALWQAQHVRSQLERAHPGLEVELIAMTTAPDTDLTRPISEIGGKGLFAKEVQQAVLDGRADLAVHSAKDLPSTTVDGLVLASVPQRGDARDVLVGCALVDLPIGSVVATGSNRRRTQLQHLRPDLRFVGLRGNMQRRVDTVGAPVDGGGSVTAIVAAGAGLLRQDLEDRITDWLPTHLVTPQVGQGALAVECRSDDAGTIELVQAIEHGPSRRQVDAERSFLAALGGDCDVPAGAHATLEDDEVIALRVVVASLDATRVERTVVRGRDPQRIGADALAALPVEDLLGDRA